VAVAAPTGKAAVRISEVMHGHGLEITAKTWHSLLGVGEVDKVSGRFGFNHNEKNPLQYKVIIGDESSMLDTDLMTSVIKARAVGTQILFLGDVNQLPPVGHGAPLRDMISAGLPYGELTEIQRNSGGIVEACAAMRDGETWGEGDNLKIDSRPDQVKSIVDQLHQAAANGYNPVWNCQVVVAVNEKSPLSRKAVNVILQEEFNENEKIKGSPFRPGDKIVCLKNGFFPLHDETGDPDEIDMDEDGRAYVANGELAKVEEVEEKFFVASLNSPERVIKIPRGKSGGGENSTGCSWDLGYALSVHKSQGSEWPVVVVVLDEYPGARRICDRSWIYTAISRAKDSCILVGKKSTADSMCRRQSILNRKTFLRERILLNAAKRELVEL
jgi:exodeoxyribonuclease V alpha subunit